MYSRDYFDARLEEELSRAVRHQLDLSVVRVAVTDDLPEAELFARVARAVKSTMRRADIVARTDTREISAVLPHTGESCATVMQRLSTQLNSLQTQLPRGFTFAIGDSFVSRLPQAERPLRRRVAAPARSGLINYRS